MIRERSTASLIRMIMLNWMWNYQRNWQQKSATTLFLDITTAALCLLLIQCASTARLTPPTVALVKPAEGLKGGPDPTFQKGFELYQKGNQMKARKEFEKRLQKLPDDFPSYLAIGYTYLTEKNLPMAEQYIRKSLEICPEYPQAHF